MSAQSMTAVPMPAARRRPVTFARAVNAALGGVLAVLALAAAAFIIAWAAFGAVPRVEASDSMAPTLRHGDVLWLSERPVAQARVGDIVGFEQNGKVIVHRVTRIEPGTLERLRFTTRGDANTASEQWVVARSATLAYYTGFKVPAVGRVSAALHGAPLAALAAICALTLAGLALRAIWSSP